MTHSNRKQSELPKTATSVAESLTRSFRSVVDSLPGRPQRPRHIANCLGANQNLAHRLWTAIGKTDPLEALLNMPGPNPLAQFADAAEAHGAPSDLCNSAREAVQDFEELVQAVGNDRTTFDTVLSEWVPTARTQLDTTARQSVYRGLRQIHGVSAQTYFFAAVMHPSATNEQRHDVLVTTGNVGLQRLRSTGHLVLSEEVHMLGNAATAESQYRVLTEYCCDPQPTFHTVESETSTRYFMEWDDTFGKASNRNVVLSCMLRNGFVRRRQSLAIGSITTNPEVPARRMIFDLVLHRDCLVNCLPYYQVYTKKRTGPNSPSNTLDQINIIPHDVEVQSVRDGGLHELRTPEVPFYQDMLGSQCNEYGWNLSEFRAFRVRMDYPLLDADHQFVIPLPEATGT